VLRATTEEVDGVATGTAKLTAAVAVTTRLLSVVSVAVYVTFSAVEALTVNTACPFPSMVVVAPGEPPTSIVE
jgi:hypothetical protein